MKLGLQLYQVDHRSYLLDFRNLNTNVDSQSGSLVQNVPLDVRTSRSGIVTDDEMENVQPNRSLSWDFTENENGFPSPDDAVSEVMEFFEVAASLIRTLAPDSAAKPAVGSS